MKSQKFFQVGILGGGQLARMLCLKAHEMGLSTAVFSGSKSDPAAQVSANWICGDLQSPTELSAFLKTVKVATFESEFMDASLLSKIQSDVGVQFYPTLPQMACWQDRWSQKNALKKAGIPTAPFCQVFERDTYQSIMSQLKTANFVVKKRFGGYDGYGTFLIHSERDFQKFSKANVLSKTPCIAEAFIPFRRELAVTFGRNPKGQIVHFPLVESFQKNSRCLWVKGPVKSKQAPALIRILSALLKKSRYVGVIAFELFETKAGQLLVNEVAPRVHNSSHYSLNGFDIDQFSLHLRCILNHNLIEPQALTPGFAMYNLLGSGRQSHRLTTSQNVQVHWYGKLESKPGRKMGHLNAQGATPEQALIRATKARKDIQL